MKRGNLLSLVLVAVVLALATALAACGSDDGDNGGQAQAADIETDPQSRQAYNEILRELKAAEASGKPYFAVQEAQDLDKPEKLLVEEFCNFAFQIRVNAEERKLGNEAYIADRITNYAAYSVGPAYDAPIDAGLRELQATIDLGSLDSKQLKRFEEACYKR